MIIPLYLLLPPSHIKILNPQSSIHLFFREKLMQLQNLIRNIYIKLLQIILPNLLIQRKLLIQLIPQPYLLIQPKSLNIHHLHTIHTLQIAHYVKQIQILIEIVLLAKIDLYMVPKHLFPYILPV